MTLSELRPGNIIMFSCLPCMVVSVDAEERLVTARRKQYMFKEELKYFLPLPISSKTLIKSLHFKADGLADVASFYTKQTDDKYATIVQTIHRNWMLTLIDLTTHDIVHLPVSYIHQIQNASWETNNKNIQQTQ